ncbi:hypothetical protein PQR34_28990 [Paraburkholderia sediminicola]|uniref:hypothetical protein n=1 Tax=Paraburkholderia sediminicola TaxID=458836 RepID=UPI0038B6EB65
MHAAQSLNQNSIVQRFLLGNPDSTLRTAMTALGVVSTLFSRIEPLAAAGDAVADLAGLGCRTLSDALTECREHANSGDMIGVVDCLSRAVSAHSIAKNLFLGIVELGDTNVAELAQLGVNLAMSVLDDLGA